MFNVFIYSLLYIVDIFTSLFSINTIVLVVKSQHTIHHAFCSLNCVRPYLRLQMQSLISVTGKNPDTN